MKVVRWLSSHLWLIVSWVFTTAAFFNFGNDKGVFAALLALAALAVYEVLTALRPKPIGLTELEAHVSPAAFQVQQAHRERRGGVS